MLTLFNFNLLFKKIGIVVDPPLLDLDVPCADCDVSLSSSSSIPLIILIFVARCVLVDDVDDDDISLFFGGLLLLIVETFPPLLIRLLFGPTIPEKSTFGGGTIELMIWCCFVCSLFCCR
ncbi:MAG: hypothetical protein ACI90V_006090 [Bacillariaceae sp.]|jgi:hypothetical protein